jgi:hypothetical protein
MTDDAPGHDFGWLSDDDLDAVLRTLRIAACDSDDRSCPLPRQRDYARAMAGAALCGVGERLWHDHMFAISPHEVDAGKLTAALIDNQHSSGGWATIPQRLQATHDRLMILTSALTHFSGAHGLSDHGSAATAIAAQLTAAAITLITATAEYDVLHAPGPAKDALSQARRELQTLTGSLGRIIETAPTASADDNCQRCAASAAIGGILCVCGHDWSCHPTGPGPKEPCSHCSCQDMRTPDDPNPADRSGH